MIRIATLIFLVWSIPLHALAETVYVNDSLRVGVRAEPNNNVAPHGVVITGMKLEVLDHSDGYIKIRNESGVEGWIKDVYVTPDKPAKLELAAAQAEQAKLQAQLAKQDAMLKDYTAKSSAMSAELEKLKTTNTELHTRLSETTAGKGSKATLNDIAYIVMLVVLGGGGFFAGVIWHRKQAMKRLGGLRV
jgi:SH3 domain protein